MNAVLERALAAAFAVTALVISAPVTAGPISELFLTSGTMVYVVQGNAVVRSFAAPAGGEYAIAVNNTVRTVGYQSSEPGGREYTLAGTTTGTSFAFPGGVLGDCCMYDSTTDGASHFVADYASGNVYRTATDWTGPVLLFNAGGGELSITYDPTDDTLWLHDLQTTQMQHYTMDGTLLSSFATQFSNEASLALDHADGTLWMGRHASDGRLQQYAKDGTFLGSSIIADLPTGTNLLGGEFDFAGYSASPSDAPEPATVAIFGLGLGMAGFVLGRRRT